MFSKTLHLDKAGSKLAYSKEAYSNIKRVSFNRKTFTILQRRKDIKGNENKEYYSLKITLTNLPIAFVLCAK